MRRKMMAATAGVAVVLVFAFAAFADQVSGTGTTHNGGKLGFNAQADLSGELNYQSPAGAVDLQTGLPLIVDIHCANYIFYRQKLVGSPDPIYPYVRVRSKTCYDKVSGNPVITQGEFVDRGEPGTRDTVRLLFCWTSPCDTANAFYIDGGKIQSGNVQITTSPNPDPNAQMLVDAPVA
jgi:hypothetical protein